MVWAMMICTSVNRLEECSYRVFEVLLNLFSTFSNCQQNLLCMFMYLLSTYNHLAFKPLIYT